MLLDQLIDGTVDAIWRLPDGSFEPLQPTPGGQCLLPGSFNPLHSGHQELRAVSERMTGLQTSFELSIRNVDKPSLNRDAVLSRVQQLSHPVLLTTAPTFVGKASIIRQTTFVVGVDTAKRIVDPVYYNDSPAKMRESLHSIRRADCRFLVAGRVSGSDFQTLSDVGIPIELSDLFETIPEDQFRSDVSSSQLRRDAR